MTLRRASTWGHHFDEVLTPWADTLGAVLGEPRRAGRWLCAEGLIPSPKEPS